MSKPETPCLETCYTTAGRYAPPFTAHTPGCPNEETGCPNAPKAEAPPVDVSPGSAWQREAEANGASLLSEAPPVALKDVVRTPGCSVLSEDGRWGCSYHQAGDHCAGDNGAESAETFFRWPIQQPAPPAPKQETCKCIQRQLKRGNSTVQMAHFENCPEYLAWKAAQSAPPANVSEPPVDFFDAIRMWTPLDPKHAVIKGHAMQAYLALKAQNAALEAAHADNVRVYDELKKRTDAANAYVPSIFDSVMAGIAEREALTAELERLRDLIVAESEHRRGYLTRDMCDESDAILAARAAREGKK